MHISAYIYVGQYMYNIQINGIMIMNNIICRASSACNVALYKQNVYSVPIGKY